MVSFIFLPFAVVWFWRGTWLVIDFYLWGLGPDPILIRKSILWGALLAMAFIGITCEPVFARLTSNTQNRHILGVAGRVRTFILAWGTVSYWRVIWYIWDEFTGTGWVSALTAHVISIIALTGMGCLSCITAPVSVSKSSETFDTLVSKYTSALIHIKGELNGF